MPGSNRSKGDEPPLTKRATAPRCGQSRPTTPPAAHQRTDGSALMGVAPRDRRLEGLLESARRDPPHEVQPRAGLVVGAAAARPTERLLTHHRPGRLVVDVEV